MSVDAQKSKASANSEVPVELKSLSRSGKPVSLSAGKWLTLSGILEAAQTTTVYLPYDALKAEFHVKDLASYSKFMEDKLSALHKASEIVSGKIQNISEQEAKMILRQLNLFEQFTRIEPNGDKISREDEQSVYIGVSLLEIRGVIFANIVHFRLEEERSARLVKFLDNMTLHILDLYNAEQSPDNEDLGILISALNKLSSKLDGSWRNLSEKERETIAVLFDKLRFDVLGEDGNLLQMMRELNFEETADVDLLLGYAFREIPWETLGI